MLEVRANCATTIDGALGRRGPRPLRISSPQDMVRVHRLRAASDAILVGVGTVLADDPRLTVKWGLIRRRPRQGPLRVVLDARRRTPRGALVLNGEADTIIFHSGRRARDPRFVRVPAARGGRLSLRGVLRRLESRGVRRLLVEGGAEVLSEFLRQDLLDALTVYVAPWFLPEPGAPRLRLSDATRTAGLTIKGAKRWGEGTVIHFARSAK